MPERVFRNPKIRIQTERVQLRKLRGVFSISLMAVEYIITVSHRHSLEEHTAYYNINIVVPIFGQP
jgi:hypothetical protein